VNPRLGLARAGVFSLQDKRILVVCENLKGVERQSCAKAQSAQRKNLKNKNLLKI
jgi:hypothetical protein